MHLSAPELRETIVLDAKVLHLRCVLRRREWWNLLVQGDSDLRTCRGIDAHLDRLAVEVARLPVPVLALALVHRHLDGVAVAAMERFVAVQQRLHVVVAGGNVRQAPSRPAPDPLVDDDVLAGRETVDVDAENRPRAVRPVLVALKPRLRLAVVRDEQQDTAVDRLSATGGRKGDRKPQAAR